MAGDKLFFLKDSDFARGTRIILRLDLNVLCEDGSVSNDFRIKRALPTLDFLSKRGCRTLIISHLDDESGTTLEPVARYLEKTHQVSFAPSLSLAESMVNDIPEGGFLLVENIRREKGEVENDEVLSRRLAGLGEYYVNDAFGVSHREHASVVGVPKLLPSFAGFLLEEEIRELTPALQVGTHALFVLGGAKFETKLPLLLKFLDRYERVFVGGALANDIFHAMGLEVGTSLVSTIAPDLTTMVNNPKLRVPLDVLIERDGKTHTEPPEALSVSDRIVDAGLKTVMLLEEFVAQSDFVLWNGPLGVYQEGFTVATEQFAKTVSRSRAKSIIGGGDTIAAVERIGKLDEFDFVSTGGGAMLEYLSKETLPGIEALKR